MANCPVKTHPDWKALVKARGEDKALYLWDKYEGEVPANEFNNIFESNPELANSVYSASGVTGNIIQDNKSYYRGQIEQPTIDKNGNLILYGREDELYKRAGLKSKGVSMTDDLQSAIDYGNGQLEVAQNLASESYDAEQELDRLSENGYYLIQIPKNISNEIVKEAGEVKVIGDKIIIPKGQYKIEQVIDDVEESEGFVQGKQFQKLTAEEKGKTIEQVTKEHRSITALKDLSAKLAHRIGGKVEFENRTDADWKGYNQGMNSVLNEAYMTPDTPFHEILAHPIIRAIKNKTLDIKINSLENKLSELEKQPNKNKVLGDLIFGFPDSDLLFDDSIREGIDFLKRELNNLKKLNNQTLYQSLLKELETGRGKEVFEQVKRDYQYKEETFISPNQKIIYKGKESRIVYLKRDFEELKNLSYEEIFNLREKSKYTLKEQQEEAIVTLLGMLAADKLDAKKDATLISKLKELWKQISDFVKSLLRQDGIKIDELPITTTLNDLAEIMAYGNNKIILPGYKVEYSTPLGNKYDTLEEVNNEIRDLADTDVEVDLSDIKENVKPFESINHFTVSNYNFYKENGKWYEDSMGFPMSFEEDYVRKQYEKTSLKGFIEKNKEYEQSKEIIEQWKKENNIQYDPEEVYSRGQGFYSSIGAYSNLELDLLLKNLIQHIQDNKKAGGEFTISAFTKSIDKRLKHIEGTGDRVRFVIYPKSEHIKWAALTDVYSGSVWDAHEKVSKDKKSELLGVSFTKAPALRNINEVSPNLADIIDNLSHAHNELGIELTTDNFRIEYDDNIDYSTKKLIDNINKILDDKYGKLNKPEINLTKNLKYQIEGYYTEKFDTKEQAEGLLNDLKQGDYGYKYGKVIAVPTGTQPTQTRENTTSIESVKDKIDKENYSKYGGQEAEEGMEFIYPEKHNKKEYTSQALTNLKIAALKEVARKYPRSLITSKVVPINPNMADNSEIQYSKVGSKQDIEGFKDFVGQPSTSVKQGVSELFESNPELANSVYSAMGLTTINESEITYTDEEGNPCAKMGGRSSKFTKGSQWEVVKDLKGYPSHAQGGVDIKLGKNGFSFTRNNGVIEAKHGLVLPKIKHPLDPNPDGSIIPDNKKNNYLYNKPYVAVQDNTYVAHREVMPLEQRKKQQFIQGEQPVLKADNRTDQERKITREYTESVLNPSIARQIGEGFQKPLRWLADPAKAVGDLVSSVAPNSPLAKDLPNTNEETFEYRKNRLNPYISNKEKRNNAINEAMSLTNWAVLNTLPVEVAAGNMIKSSKNLIKPVSELSKANKIIDATKVGSKIMGKGDDVIKNLPKLEQVPLDFKIEDVLKNISSTERKNMEIIKKGNAYFRELDNLESLKRLKEFGDEYDIDLLDAYKKAEQRWDYGKSIGKHEKFQVKKTDEDWYGLSTTKWDYEDGLKLFQLKQTFGEDSKQVKDFYKKLSQKKSINYIADVVPLDRYEKTIWHELSHDINKSIIDQSPKLQKDIKNIFIEKGTADLNKVKKGREYVAEDFYTKKDKVLKDLDDPEKLKEIGKEEFDYVTRPTETWAFLSTNLRQDLKNTGVIKNYNELLTPEKLEQAIKNGNTVFSRFEPYIKDKDAFIKLFNKMTLSIAPAALYLQSQNQNKSEQ